MPVCVGPTRSVEQSFFSAEVQKRLAQMSNSRVSDFEKKRTPKSFDSLSSPSPKNLKNQKDARKESKLQRKEEGEDGKEVKEKEKARKKINRYKGHLLLMKILSDKSWVASTVRTLLS